MVFSLQVGKATGRPPEGGDPATDEGLGLKDGFANP
jgi:hypothetical protein